MYPMAQTTQVCRCVCTKRFCIALARWLSWLEHHPLHKKAEGLIPSQGTYLGCRFSPWLGVYGKQLINVSLSLKSMKISSGKDFFFLTKRFSALTIKTKTKKLELILSKSTEENTLCYTHIDLHVLVRGK